MATLFEELEGGNTSVVCLSEDTIDPFLISGCKDALELATMHSLAICNPTELFTYGPRQGLDGFRVALADFLRGQYGDNISSDNLMVTGGATQVLTLICNVFFEKGDTVFIEEPISPKELSILTALGLNAVPVPLDEDGINVDELDKQLSKVKREAHKPFCAGLFLTPCYQNPTGICLKVEKCQQLVDVMAKYHCLCISNDVYQCLSYEKGKAPFGPPPKRLITYDIRQQSSNGNTSSGHVISIGSFSTIFCPGLRMGWIEALPNVLEYLKISPFVRYCGSSQQYLSGVMESVLSLGLVKDSFESLRLTLHNRMERLCEVLNEKIPQCTFIKPKGGIFLWLSLPSSIDSQDLLKLCKEKYQVEFLPGNVFSCSSTKFKNNLRLSTSRYGDQSIVKAVIRLGEALDELLQETQQEP